MIKNLLITGPQGIGKTTLIRKLSEIFKEFNPSGFLTAEIIEDGIKTGTMITNLYGDSQILAHLNLKSKYAIGKFHIDIKGFENILENIQARDKKTGLFFIDGIDKLECQSKKFCKLIVELLDAERPVIASIAEKGTGLISDIKKRSDIKSYEISADNRDLKLKELTMEIRDLMLD